MLIQGSNVVRIILINIVLFFSGVGFAQYDNKGEQEACTATLIVRQSPVQISQQERLSAFMQPPTCQPMSRSEYPEMCLAIQIADIQCCFRYGMNLQAKDNLMCAGYEEFVAKLFSNPFLNNETIKELWQEYLDRYIFKRKKNVVWYGKKIDDELERREDQRVLAQKEYQEKIDRQSKGAELKEAQQKETLRLQQEEKDKTCVRNVDIKEIVLPAELSKEFLQRLDELYQLNFENNCTSEGFTNRVVFREQALLQTKLEKFAPSEKQYNLSPQVAGYLISQNLNPSDYSEFYGTTLQHVFHDEICDIFGQAATLHREISYCSDLLHSGVLFADAACQVNAQERVQLTTMLADTSFGLLDCAKACSNAWVNTAVRYAPAISLALIHSAQDLGHMATHPLETINCLGKAIYYVLETAALNSYDQADGYQNVYEPIRDQRNNEIRVAIGHLGTQLYNSSGPQRLEALTKFSVDFFIPEKIFHAVGATLGVIRSQVNVARTLEGAAGIMGEEFGLENVAQEVTKTAEGLQFSADETLVQESITKSIAKECIEAEVQSAKNAKLAEEIANFTIDGLRPFKEIVNESRLFNGKIPLNRTDLLAEIEQYSNALLHKAAMHTDPLLVEQFSEMMKVYNGTHAKITLDIKHILNFELKITEKSGLGHFEINFEGGHLPGSCHALEKAGLAKIKKHTLLPSGAIEYKLESALTGKSFGKTEFPVSWDSEKIIKSCWEVFDNPSKLDRLSTDRKFIREGIIDESFNMSIILKAEEAGQCQIVTGLPYTIELKQ